MNEVTETTKSTREYHFPRNVFSMDTFDTDSQYKSFPDWLAEPASKQHVATFLQQNGLNEFQFFHIPHKGVCYLYFPPAQHTQPVEGNIFQQFKNFLGNHPISSVFVSVDEDDMAAFTGVETVTVQSLQPQRQGSVYTCK